MSETTPNVDAKAGPYKVHLDDGVFDVVGPGVGPFGRLAYGTCQSDTAEREAERLNTAYAQGQRAADERYIEAIGLLAEAGSMILATTEGIHPLATRIRELVAKSRPILWH